MEAKQKDGTVIHPQTVCGVPYCGEPSAVRLGETPEYVQMDNEKKGTRRKQQRRDLCVGHARTTMKQYGEFVDVLAVWNGEEMEDWNE